MCPIIDSSRRSGPGKARQGAGRVLLALVLAGLMGCAGTRASPADRATAQAVIAELQRGHSVEAMKLADQATERGSHLPLVHGARALVRTFDLAHDLYGVGYATVMAIAIVVLKNGLEASTRSGRPEQDPVRALGFLGGVLRLTAEALEGRLAAISRDLEQASVADFRLRACPSCCVFDGDGDGKIDETERKVWQGFFPGTGSRTVLFDQADMLWLRSRVELSRAVIELLLAYHWRQALLRGESPALKPITLSAPERIARARALLQQWLASNRAARKALAEERDDQDEWIANPRQRSSRLRVGDREHQLWGDVLDELDLLVKAETAVPLRLVAPFFKAKKLEQAQGHLSFAFLYRPGNLAYVPSSTWNRLEGSADVDRVLAQALGAAYLRAASGTRVFDRVKAYAKQAGLSEEAGWSVAAWLLGLGGGVEKK